MFEEELRALADDDFDSNWEDCASALEGPGAAWSWPCRLAGGGASRSLLGTMRIFSRGFTVPRPCIHLLILSEGP